MFWLPDGDPKKQVTHIKKPTYFTQCTIIQHKAAQCIKIYYKASTNEFISKPKD
jgi:hypothetical protein